MLTLRLQFDQKSDDYIQEKMIAIRSRMSYQLKNFDIDNAFRWGFQQNNSGFVKVFIDESKVIQLTLESNDISSSQPILPTDSELLNTFIRVIKTNEHILGCEMLYTGEECDQYKSSQFRKVGNDTYFSIDHLR